VKTKLQEILTAVMVCALALTAHVADSNIEQKRKDIRSMEQDTLKRLYKAEPKAKSAVEGAGYAVFSNLGVKILVAGSGNGKGVAVDNKSKKETFMKMLELQAGLGSGIAAVDNGGLHASD
jgi:hypothetical protein